MSKVLVLLVISVFMWVSPVQSFVLLMSGGEVSGGSGGECGNLGTEEILWEGEHSSGTTYACISGDSLQGTLSGATVSDEQNYTPDGQYSLKVTSTDDYLSFPVTGKDIFDSAEGSLKIMYYASAVSSSQGIFEAFEDWNNLLFVYVNSAKQLAVKHKGDGSEVTTNSLDTINLSQWNTLEVRWSATENKISVKVNSGSWRDDSDEDTVTAFTSEPTTILMGELYFGFASDSYYLDDMRVWLTYDQS